jgi:transposase
MAHSYVPVDRDQPFLLPPDMREWLPAGHLVWFVLAVVERVDTAVLHARHPNDGAGRRAYDPDMLLALLVYAYCTAQRSSRQIERLCEVDVAYRVLCANRVPDHSTIARFRQDHQDQAVRLFTDVLVLCAQAGLAKVGVVAVDGTKVGGDASLHANRTRARIEAEVRAMLVEAAEVDAVQDGLFADARGDELPVELVDPRSRRARLDAALAELEAQERAARAAIDARRARRAQAEEEAGRGGRGLTGRLPKDADRVAAAEAALARAEERHRAQRAAVKAARETGDGRPVPAQIKLKSFRDRLQQEQAKAAAQASPSGDNETGSAGRRLVNVTDPDSRIMKTPGGWVQGYNAQAAVNDQGVVLAGTVVNDHTDLGQCQPMTKLTEQQVAAAGIVDPIGTMLFDAGYWSIDNATAPGPDRLIATSASWKLKQTAKHEGFATGPAPNGMSATQAMEHRLQTQEGRALYAKRGTTVEPLFGQHKDARGFRRFMRRGLPAVNAEWQLINTTHNILKMFRANVTLT